MKWNKEGSQSPEDGFYLVRCPNYCESDYQVANWDNTTFSWYIEEDDRIDSFVTHWMELPPKP